MVHFLARLRGRLDERPWERGCIVFRTRTIVSVVYSIVFSANLVKPYERCVAPQFFIKYPGLWECLLGDFRGLFLVIVFNDILTMQRFLDISRFLYSGRCQVLSWSYFMLITGEETESAGKMD